MIIVMRASASVKEIEHVTSRIDELGFQVHLSQGAERTIIGVIGDERPLDRAMFEVIEGVERTVSILPPYKLASREWRPEGSVITVGTVYAAVSKVSSGACAASKLEPTRSSSRSSTTPHPIFISSCSSRPAT